MDLWDNSRQIDMRIVEIRRKLLEQKPIFGYVLWKQRYQTALVGFRFWIEIRNRETILVKMVAELLKSARK
jgi:hypothetical protein